MFFGFIGEYITPLLTEVRGYSFYPLLMSLSEAFSNLYYTLIKLYYTKAKKKKKKEEEDKIVALNLCLSLLQPPSFLPILQTLLSSFRHHPISALFLTNLSWNLPSASIRTGCFSAWLIAVHPGCSFTTILVIPITCHHVPVSLTLCITLSMFPPLFWWSTSFSSFLRKRIRNYLLKKLFMCENV